MSGTQTTSIVLVGVGGQGILLASEIISQAAMAAGYQVKTNEVHGMAQRGGSVMAQIRYGQEVYSPLIEEGTARILGSFEPIEAIRAAHYLAPDGFAAVSSQMIVPVTVSSGAARYPDDVEDRLNQIFPRLRYFNAAEIAGAVGTVKAANVVLLGAMSSQMDLPLDAWHQAIAKCVPEKYFDLNERAFAAGRGEA